MSEKQIKANLPLHFELGGLISGWAYIRNNIFIGKWMGLYPGGLKTGGGFKEGFYGMSPILERQTWLHFAQTWRSVVAIT